ncbi:MAG: PIG-L family deacetylase [Acidimicrobiia bacterium]
MIGLRLERAPISVVCLGAHPDDIEVGAAGLLASLAERYSDTRFLFAIATGDSDRQKEATDSAHSLLGDRVSLEFGGLTDGMLPYSHAAETKAFIRATAQSPEDVDLVLAPRRGDRHQDHRLVGDLAHQIFRSQMILEYEIVKLEGDLGPVGAYHSLTFAAAESKLDHLTSHFPSQQSKPWYDRETFAALMRIRGVECLSTDGYAEAFHADRMSIL